MRTQLWLAIVVQVLALLAAVIRLEHRISTLEADVRWIAAHHQPQPITPR